MPEMEDSLTLNEHTEDFRGILDIALHHTCMQESRIRALQHEPTGPDHQICGLSEPESQHLDTLYPLARCAPAIPCTTTPPAGSYDPAMTRGGNMNV